MKKIRANKLYSLLGHNDSIYCLEVLDNSRFFSVGSDGMIVLWDLKIPNKGEVIAKFEGSCYAMLYHASEKALYFGHNYEGIRKIDLNTKKEVTTILLKEQIFSLYSMNGHLLVACGNGELITIDKSMKKKQHRKFSTQRIRNIDQSKSELAISCGDNKICILNKDFSVVYNLIGHKKSIFFAKYHPSGKYLISGGMDAHLRIWDTSVNYLLRESIPAHLHTINDLAFRSDGRYFATVSMDKTVKLWDAYNFRLLKVLDKDRHSGHRNSINSVIWMSFGKELVTCSDDRTVSVWEISE